MKKTLFSLVAVLALTVAGIAWAGQAAVPAPEASEPAVEAVTAAGESAVEEITIEDLFADPVEVGACCFADCWSEWEACVSTCGEDTACRQSCTAARQACTNYC